MTYTLTQDLITGPQTIREGMCLADWEQAPGFSWDKLEDLDALADLILPPKIAALRAYNFDPEYDSPNYGGFGTQIALPAKRVVLHWWGNPSGQNPYGIINWLCNPASQVSAHSVIWPNNVACIVAYDQPSWANGNTTANTTAITIECDPNNITATTLTVIEYLADLVRQNVLDPDFELTGHRTWYNTTCPGDYYPRLAGIRQAVRDNLAGAATTDTTTTTTDKELTMADVEDLKKSIDWISYQLTGGKAGEKTEGAVREQMRLQTEALGVIREHLAGIRAALETIAKTGAQA